MSGRAGTWQKLLRWVRGETDIAGVLEEPRESDEPVVLRSEEERWLEQLAVAVGEGERLGDLGDRELFDRIDRLYERRHERLAREWLEKFIAAPATPPDAITVLRVKLVDYLERQSDLLAAAPHLEHLTKLDEHATRAHYLLGEHYRRRGEEALALRHYEAVLARDMDYPNVRARLDRLRVRRGHDAPAAGGETIASPDALGGVGGARYRLLRELGRGATGVVYMARDAQLERDVAVKLLHPHLAASQRAAACRRFFDEARVAASLRHPNIIAILDLDERARRIVMELGSGGTLREVLSTRGPRPLRRALERHAQILSALAAAHRRGVVHRDLKPGNLMFRRDPDAPGAEIMLGDFGVAHLPNAEGETGIAAVRTDRPAEAVGTLAYMSPEQRKGAEADPRSDLYAAAVVLFEMLTARPPWSRDVLLSGVRTAEDFTLPPEVTAEAAAPLARRLQAHLALIGSPDPALRPQTTEALTEARALRDLAIAAAL